MVHTEIERHTHWHTKAEGALSPHTHTATRYTLTLPPRYVDYLALPAHKEPRVGGREKAARARNGSEGGALARQLSAKVLTPPFQGDPSGGLGSCQIYLTAQVRRGVSKEEVSGEGRGVVNRALHTSKSEPSVLGSCSCLIPFSSALSSRSAHLQPWKRRD